MPLRPILIVRLLTKSSCLIQLMTKALNNDSDIPTPEIPTEVPS